MSETASGTNRSAGLDAARIVAAGAIVWIHTIRINPNYNSIGNLGRFAVPFFVLSSVLLTGESLRRGRAKGFAEFAKRRVERIYFPFLVWTAIYWVLRNLKPIALYLVRGQSTQLVPFELYMLVVGSTHHLWFLPFILFVSLASFPLLQIIVQGKGSATVLAGAAFVAGLAVALWPNPFPFDPADATLQGRLRYLLKLGWDASPAALWGLSLAAVYPRIKILEGRRFVGAAALLLTALLLAFVVQQGRNNLLENLAGVAWLFVAVGFSTARLTRWLGGYGVYSYGVYLVHVAVVLGIEAFLVRDRSAVSLATLVMLTLGSFVMSTFISIALSRSKYTRFLVP